jgi:5-methylcytosine-specific restriction endonuclease McrA
MRSSGAIQLYRSQRKRCLKSVALRLALLKKWAQVKVTRSHFQERTLDQMRAAANRSLSKPRGEIGQCWVCRKTALLVCHHVIQLQNGGSNWHLNLEMICDACHAEIHPWLADRESRSWRHLVSLMMDFGESDWPMAALLDS